MLIRDMTVNDLDPIVMLEKELFSSPWSKNDFIYELQTNPFSRIIVLEKDNEILGYIGFWLLGDQSQITTLGIKKDNQGKGYAKILMNACIEETMNRKYPTITLEVRVSNKRAIRLYQSYGFEIITTRKKYYQDTGEDAYLMLKKMEVE